MNDRLFVKRLHIKIVGDRIRILRSEKELSQEELADNADIDPSHMGRLERGERNPSLLSLEKTIKALGETFEDLFKYTYSHLTWKPLRTT